MIGRRSGCQEAEKSERTDGDLMAWDTIVLAKKKTLDEYAKMKAIETSA